MEQVAAAYFSCCRHLFLAYRADVPVCVSLAIVPSSSCNVDYLALHQQVDNSPVAVVAVYLLDQPAECDDQLAKHVEGDPVAYRSVKEEDQIRDHFAH